MFGTHIWDAGFSRCLDIAAYNQYKQTVKCSNDQERVTLCIKDKIPARCLVSVEHTARRLVSRKHQYWVSVSVITALWPNFRSRRETEAEMKSISCSYLEQFINSLKTKRRLLYLKAQYFLKISVHKNS